MTRFVVLAMFLLLLLTATVKAQTQDDPPADDPPADDPPAGSESDDPQPDGSDDEDPNVIENKGLTESAPITIPTASRAIRSKYYPWNLSSSNRWRQFPNLVLYIRVSRSQYVDISYTVSGGFRRSSHFLTKIMVNGYEDTRFRQISGNTYYFTNSKSDKRYLTSGRTHKIQLYYRTPGTVRNLSNKADWGRAYLQVFRY